MKIKILSALLDQLFERVKRNHATQDDILSRQRGQISANLFTLTGHQ